MAAAFGWLIRNIKLIYTMLVEYTLRNGELRERKGQRKRGGKSDDA